MWTKMTFAALFMAAGCAVMAGSGPYFDSYTHHMEVGEWELEIGADAVQTIEGSWEYGQQIEMEHGFNEHWAGSLYVVGGRTGDNQWELDGYKVEARFRPWTRNFFFIPTFYLEYEQFHHEELYRDSVEGNAEHEEASRTTEHEAEARLIFSQDFDWGNVVLNIVGERSLDGGRTAIGYTAGFFIKGPSSGIAGAADFDPDQDGDSHVLFGAEAFGGLGQEGDLGPQSHLQEDYIQPFLALPLSKRVVLKSAVAVGLTRPSENRFRLIFVVRLGKV